MTGPSQDHIFLHSENPGQNIWNKTEESSKVEQDEKGLISIFACFSRLLPKFHLRK